eukprot:s46_g44.t1
MRLAPSNDTFAELLSASQLQEWTQELTSSWRWCPSPSSGTSDGCHPMLFACVKCSLREVFAQNDPLSTARQTRKMLVLESDLPAFCEATALNLPHWTCNFVTLMIL